MSDPERVFISRKIQLNEQLDENVINHENWEKAMVCVLGAYYRTNPQEAKKQARAMGIDVEWSEWEDD